MAPVARMCFESKEAIAMTVFATIAHLWRASSFASVSVPVHIWTSRNLKLRSHELELQLRVQAAAGSTSKGCHHLIERITNEATVSDQFHMVHEGTLLGAQREAQLSCNTDLPEADANNPGIRGDHATE